MCEYFWQASPTVGVYTSGALSGASASAWWSSALRLEHHTHSPGRSSFIAAKKRLGSSLLTLERWTCLSSGVGRVSRWFRRRRRFCSGVGEGWIEPEAGSVRATEA